MTWAGARDQVACRLHAMLCELAAEFPGDLRRFDVPMRETISRSAETAWPCPAIRRASTHRCLGPPTLAGTLLTVTSSGPSTLTLITGTSLTEGIALSVAVSAGRPQVRGKFAAVPRPRLGM